MPTVELSSGPVSYGDTGGSGPVLVFCHGLLMNGLQWRKVLPLLSGYRCITPTLPLGAHTVAMKPDADLTQLGVARILADFLDALDLDDVTLVLNDWGGGQFVISDGRADRVGRLVLASCEAFDNFPPKPARPAAMLCRIPGGGWLFTKMMGTSFFRHNRKAYGVLSKRGVPDEVYDQWFRPSTENRDIRRDMVKFCTGAPPRRVLLEWADRLPAFTRPVLVLWAREDLMFPLEHAERLATTFTDSTLVLVDDSLTLIPEDQPEKFADALTAFVG